MKKIISLTIGLSILLGSTTAIFAKAAIDTPVTVNGEVRASGFIEKGVTHIPVRSVSETLGAIVDWDKVTGIVTITKESKKVAIKEPRIIQGTTYVPLRFVSENLGAKVNWNSKIRRVEITADFVKPIEINTIESLGLTGHKIADNPLISKSNVSYKHYDSVADAVVLKEDVVFITPKDLPLKFGNRIIYGFNIKGDILTIEQRRIIGDNSPIILELAVPNEGVYRYRNADYKHPTVKLPNGRILATYDEVAFSDDAILGFDNYKSFKWGQVEYFIIQNNEVPQLIALKNPAWKGVAK